MGWGRDRVPGRRRRRMVEQAKAEHLREHPLDHRVQDRLGDRAIVDGVLERLPEELVERLLLVEARERTTRSAVQGAIVGGDEPGEVPLLLEHVGEQERALAGEVAVHDGVRAHRRRGLGLLHGRLEGGEVDLVHRAIADQRVVLRRVAVGLLVVDREVLDLRHLTHALHSVDLAGRQRRVQERILRERLERATPPRVAVDVHGRPEVHCRALAQLLRADHLAVLARQARVEGRGEIDSRRKLGDADQLVGDAGRSVLLTEGGDAQRLAGGRRLQARHPEHIRVGRRIRPLVGRAMPLHQEDLVGHGHVAHDVGDATGNRLTRAHPRTLGVRRMGSGAVAGRRGPRRQRRRRRREHRRTGDHRGGEHAWTPSPRSPPSRSTVGSTITHMKHLAPPSALDLIFWTGTGQKRLLCRANLAHDG